MKKLLIFVLALFLFASSLAAKEYSLIEASKKGNYEKVLKLLKNGANKSLKDKKGLSALDWAIKNEHSSIAQMLYSNNKNDYIFLSPKGKAPIYMKLDKKGFNIKNKTLNKKVILFGAVSLYTFKKSAQAFDKFLKKSKIKPKNFVFIAMIANKNNYKKFMKLNDKLMKYTTIVFLNFKFYKLLITTLKFTGTPLFLLRNDKGKIVDGWIGWTIFANSKNFAKLI